MIERVYILPTMHIKVGRLQKVIRLNYLDYVINLTGHTYIAFRISECFGVVFSILTSCQNEYIHP